MAGTWHGHPDPGIAVVELGFLQAHVVIIRVHGEPVPPMVGAASSFQHFGVEHGLESRGRIDERRESPLDMGASLGVESDL